MKYFLHDTNAFQDEKIMLLYMNFGFEGLGLFYTLLEKIALQEKPVVTTVLKKQLFVGKKLEKCWKFMESIDLISSNNGETFNKQLLNFSETFQIKKEKNKKRISEWRDKQLVTENVTRSENVRNTPKVNRSKVKESKVKESKVNSNDFLSKIITSFQSCYFDVFQVEYSVVAIGKERAAAGKIISLYKSKYPESNSEETLEGLTDFFKKCCTVPDQWLQQNMSLPIIVSKFNEIKNIITNGKSKKIVSVASRSDEVTALINAVYDAKGVQ